MRASKMKILGAICWGIIDARFDTARRVFDEQWYRRRIVQFWRQPERAQREPERRRSVGQCELGQPWQSVEWQWGVCVRRPCNSLYFSPCFGRVEFFVSCPFHPPNILPTSSNISDNAMNFLVSSDFVSHKIRQSNFNVSTFFVARRTYGSFSSRGRNAAAEIASMISINNVSILAPSEYRCNFGSSVWYVCQSK